MPTIAISMKKNKSIFFLRIVRNFLAGIGIFFLICIALAFTEQPFWAYYWLGTSKAQMKWQPEVIVVMGGSGMPSQSNLMRTWYAASAAHSLPDAQIIIAMPGNISDSLSSPNLMKSELDLRGIQPEKIRFENIGTNTRGQALNCAKMLQMQTPILLVTSPEHIRRAVLCFQKAGFEKVNALPAFENVLEADLKFDDDSLGGDKTLVPDVGKSMNARYQLWNHLKYEIVIVREITALTYYRVRGWI